MLNHMINLEPLANTMYDVMLENFKEYMITGGMQLLIVLLKIKTLVEY